MKKGSIFILVILAGIVLLASGTAELRTRLKPVPNFTPRRSVVSFTGPQTGSTATEYTFTVNNGGEDARYYVYSVGVLNDGTFANNEYADTLYDEWNLEPGESNEFKYTFYETGIYGIWCYRYDANMNSLLWIYEGEEYEFVYWEIEINADDPDNNPLTIRVNKLADECMDEATDDYSLALAISDKLNEIITYDDSETYFSPEAGLLNGTCVCNGYSRAFNLIATACGLESRRCVGGKHAWDAVKMDDEWYYVDPTWNDTTSSHRYFGINQTILDFDHTTENTVGGAVACNSLADNYYVRSGKWTIMAATALQAMESRVAGRAHLFSIGMGNRILTETGTYTSSEAQRNCNGHVTAFMFSQYDWTCDATGETFATDFTYDYDTNTITGVFTAEGTLTLPDDLTELEDESFSGVEAYYVIIPVSCTTIGANVFSGSRVWEVTIPASVVNIDPHAFDGTNGLMIRTENGTPADDFAREHQIEVLADISADEM